MPYQGNVLENSLSIDKIITVHYFNYPKNFAFSGETHDFWELVFVDSGEVTVTDGKDSHILEQGNMILHHPNVFHNITANNQYSNIVIISFECSNPALQDIKRGTLSVSSFEKQLLNVIIEEATSTFEEPLNIIYLEKMTKKEEKPFGSEQNIKSCIEMLLISLIRNESKRQSVEYVEKNISYQLRIVNEIKSILKENITNKISLQLLSDKLGYSKTYLKLLFKKRTGTSIMKYFISLKILEAKRLISENEYSFSEISSMLGYDSVQYFCTQFKNHTNMTPSAYLKSVRVMEVL